MGSSFIQKVCLIQVPSETLKNLRGEVTGPKKTKKMDFFGSHKYEDYIKYEKDTKNEDHPKNEDSQKIKTTKK